MDTDLFTENLKLNDPHLYITLLEERLQNAINESAMLQEKLEENSKIWKGLESKFSSSKELCDRYATTMAQLVQLVRDCAQDREALESKLSSCRDSYNDLLLQFHSVSKKLESAETDLRTSEKQLVELTTEREKKKADVDNRNRISKLLDDKDSLIKDLKGEIADQAVLLESLTFDLEKLQHELHEKDKLCQQLIVTHENLEKEKRALQSSNNDYAGSLLESVQEEASHLPDIQRAQLSDLPFELLKVIFTESMRADKSRVVGGFLLINKALGDLIHHAEFKNHFGKDEYKRNWKHIVI